MVLGMVAMLIICTWVLGPGAESPPGSNEGFFQAALNPAFTDQSLSLPEDATPFLKRIGGEMLTTIRFAFIAMSLSVPTGIILGFFASTTWWPLAKKSGTCGKLAHIALWPLHLAIKLLITLMRSIHELIWAILFLIAIGNDPITGCIALALPFSGTLAKVFSEIIDEQTPQARDHLIASGASPLQAFLMSMVPQSFPNMATYTLYRFECALRSSAVLGFIGIETIGLSIKRSFENNFYNELWTELYLLLGVIMLVDILGSQLRKRLNSIAPRKETCVKFNDATNHIRHLKRSAPRWKITRILFWLTCILTTISWLPSLVNIDAQELTRNTDEARREESMERFLKKITPAPVRAAEAQGEHNAWGKAIPWANRLWKEEGRTSLTNTLAMATAAIITSAFAAWLLLPWASRVFASSRPLGTFSGLTSRIRDATWSLCGFLTRSTFLVSRAIPEYIIAYLLIGLLGLSAWPLVLALALHNFGILGRLWSEVTENQPPAEARHLVYSGAGRLQAYFASYVPTSFNRFLMYLFYRWETCVREATILGMLGFASLGLQIHLARNFSRAYDEMLFYVLLGAAVIFIGDLASFFLRRALTKS